MSRSNGLLVTRRGFGGLAFGAGVAVALPWGAAMAATPPDTVVLAWAFDDIITMDPGESFEISAGEIMGNTYNRLVKLNLTDTSKVEPDVAASWTVSEDGKTFTFELKPNLVFASGNPITADDVVWSLQRAVKLDKSPAFILTQFGWTKETVDQTIKAASPTTVSLTTDAVYAPTLVLNCLTANVAAVVDKALVAPHEADGDFGNAWLKTNFAGSGPFKLREWRANELIVMERNEKYADGPQPILSRVIYRHVKEPATQRLMLEKGDVDIARNLAPQDIDALAGNPDFVVNSVSKASNYYISLNQKNPILAKPEVREAFKYIVDYDTLEATILKNIGKVQQHFLPVGMLGALDTRPYTYDLDKAKALLEKAGLKDGFTVTMDVRTIQPVQGVAEAIQQSAAKVGIKIEIIPGDGKQVLTKYRARNHDIYIGNWGADYWDPHTNADTFTRNPNNADDATSKPLAWRNAWDIPELTKKTAAAAQERDEAKRVALYAELQNEFVATSPFVMIWQQIEVAVLSAKVKDFQLGRTSDNTVYAGVSKA